MSCLVSARQVRVAGALAVVAGLTLWPPVGAASTRSAATAYVVGNLSNTVTAIDLGTDTASRPIKVGNGPTMIVITPDGRTAYVANSATRTVTPIDVASNKAGSAITVGRHPGWIAVTPDGAKALVANSTSNTVTVIRTATNTVRSTIKVGKDPTYIAITPDGSTAYVSNLGSNTVTPIRVATNTAGPPIKVGRAPGQIAITPNGKWAFVVDSYIHGTSVTPIDVATNTSRKAIHVGPYPHEIAITPDGRTAYVACFNVDVPYGQLGVGSVWPIRVGKRTVGPAIPFGNLFPNEIVVTPNSDTAYVTTGSGVVPIDVVDGTRGSLIKAGVLPWAIAIAPGGNTAYVTDIGTEDQPVSAVRPLHLATGKVGKAITVDQRPVAIAITP